MVEDISRQIREGAEPAKVVEQLELLEPVQVATALDDIAAMKSEEAAKVLTLFSEKVQDKRLRKLVKRALFHLKTQGIRIEEPARTEEPSILKKVETDRESRALLTNYDPEQTRALVAALELKKHQFVFTQAIIHFSNGLVDLRSFPVPRRDLDSIIGEYREKTHSPMVVASISAPYAGYLIEEASGISGKEHEEARDLGHLFRGVTGEVARPSDIYHLPVPHQIGPSSMASVLGDEMFEPFLFSWPGMDEDGSRLAEAINPSIVLPPHVIQERREAFLKTLVGDKRIVSKSMELKRMLEDSAYLFHSLSRFDHYKGLIAILETPQSTVAALLYFIQKTLAGLDKKDRQQAPDLIIDPHSLTRK